MHELTEVLFQPSRWNDLSQLAPHHRIILSLAVLALSLIIAVVLGLLGTRWGRARAERSGATNGHRGPVAERIGRIRRGLIALTVFFGSYLAVEVAPLPPHLERLLAGTTYVLGAWTVARIAIHLVTLLIATSVTRVPGDDRARIEREYVPLAQKVTTLAVMMLLVIVVAKHFGQDVTSLVAALGVGSLAIGLAAQQTLGNMIAGFVLLVDRPFRPGDSIKLASGEAGEVLDVGVRSTRIRLGDGNLLIVPNAELVNSRVVNYVGFFPARHGEVKVQLAHGADVDAACQLLVEVASQDQRVKPTPSAFVSAIQPTGVEVTLGFDVISGDSFGATVDIRKRVLRRITEAKLPLAPAVPSVRVVS